MLKGLFHPACLARVVSWFAFVVAIFMAHENGDKQRPAKRRHVQGMLHETDPSIENQILESHFKEHTEPLPGKLSSQTDKLSYPPL